MSWLSKGIKGLGHVLAKPAGIAARIGGTAGGFLLGGPGGAMAGYRLGDKIGNIEEDALAGRNVRTHLGDNLLGAAEGGAGMYLAGGAPGLGGGASGGASGGYDVTDPAQNMFAGAGGSAADASGGGFLSNAVNTAKGLIPGQGGQPGQAGGSSTNPWLLGLAGLQGANSAYLGQKSNALSGKALKGVEANYAERAPLRAAGLRGLLTPTPVDTSQLSTIAQRNPYAAPPIPAG